MLFDDKLSDIIRTLENDGSLLHPTDTVWNLSCSMLSKKAFQKISSLTEKKELHHFTLLIDSLEMLKKFVPHIHPRIETLLIFHKKPLTILFPNVQQLPQHLKITKKEMAIHLVKDEYCAQIIRLLGSPLISTAAHLNEMPIPTNFENIDRRIIENVDFVSKLKREENSPLPSVFIEYDQDGEISFLRT